MADMVKKILVVLMIKTARFLLSLRKLTALLVSTFYASSTSCIKNKTANNAIIRNIANLAAIAKRYGLRISIVHFLASLIILVIIVTYGAQLRIWSAPRIPPTNIQPNVSASVLPP